MISYEISRGDKFRLAAVSFDGNKYFSRELLSGRLQLQTASFASSGRFSQSLMRADIDSIKGLYLSNGFRDAQVTSLRWTTIITARKGTSSSHFTSKRVRRRW